MKWIAAAASLVVLAGCASKPPQQAQAPAAPVGASGTASAAPALSAADAAAAQARELARNRLVGVEPSVYFDFDKFNIKQEYHNTISVFGNYLSVAKDAKMVIEGNADERGTVEYNLALGQKRAEAASIALQAIGANPKNIETISFGEERPRNSGKSEAAFAENRRADFILK